MSNAASNYLENKLLDHVLKNTAFTSPTTVYLGLFKNDSTNAAANLEAGTLTDEVSGGSYAREAVTFGSASGGVSASSATVQFPTASADWGTVTHVAIMDAATSGNVLYWGQLAVSKLVSTGDSFQMTAGNLTVTLT